MLKNIRPEMIAIQKRFFEAFDAAVDMGKTNGLLTFCNEHRLNRTKYSNIRTELRNPKDAKPTNYKVIDLDALAYLCKDFGVSPEWLLFGKGKMFK